MGTLVSVSHEGRGWYFIFLNVSFLLVASFFLVVTQFNSSEEFIVLTSEHAGFNGDALLDCDGLLGLKDFQAKCFYLKSRNPCVSEGYIDYLYFFYCNFGRFPFLGHCLLFLWLLVLFYLLGNTASEYFCSSLENLSRLLKLPPAIAGVTLLSLGNGAPDVFASLVSVTGSGTSDVGFNTVLGGASFVTCVVVGILSILVKQKGISVSKGAFIRDVSFFILVLSSLIFVLLYGEISLWGALAFLFMYIVYVVGVYITYNHWNSVGKNSPTDPSSSCESGLTIPILCSMEKGEINSMEEGANEEEDMKQHCCFCSRLPSPCIMILRILEMPLYIPRRLTIPVVCERRWSKPLAVASVTLAPLLLSALWDLQDKKDNFSTRLVVYGVGLLVGLTAGILAYLTTDNSSPPKRSLLPWLAGGFLMSVTWSYIIAQELVALLVSLGCIFGISPSILGLTVLAWGNSVGDLVTNLTMALNGGPEGVQVAISGCYAGPIFNMLFGLGLSLVGSAWLVYPSPVLIPKDPYLLETVGFLLVGLIWALVVLPRRNMKVDGILGGGLLAIYMLSVSLRLIQTFRVSPILFLTP